MVSRSFMSRLVVGSGLPLTVNVLILRGSPKAGEPLKFGAGLDCDGRWVALRVDFRRGEAAKGNVPGVRIGLHKRKSELPRSSARAEISGGRPGKLRNGIAKNRETEYIRQSSTAARQLLHCALKEYRRNQ